MRPIDAVALHEEISGLRVTVKGVRYGKDLLCELMTDYHKHILQAIDNSPTIDAVPVVRCKDCKHFVQCKEVEGVSWTGFCNYGEFHTDEEDFCSRGERRSDDL